MSIEIAQDYTSQYPDPIRFDAGAAVQVGREDPEYPGWFWCRTAAGKEGWVHRSFLAACSGLTTGLHAYSAREVSAAAGERGTLLRSADGWAFIRLDRGDEGWIPQSHLRTPE